MDANEVNQSMDALEKALNSCNPNSKQSVEKFDTKPLLAAGLMN